MSHSTEYIIDRIDEATRVNRDIKQVCNDALSLARGRLVSLQNDYVVVRNRNKELENEVTRLRDELARVRRDDSDGRCEGSAQLKRGCYVDCIGSNEESYFKGIYFGDELDCWWVLCERDSCPQKLTKSNWMLRMTGEYVDLFRCVKED